MASVAYGSDSTTITWTAPIIGPPYNVCGLGDNQPYTVHACFGNWVGATSISVKFVAYDAEGNTGGCNPPPSYCGLTNIQTLSDTECTSPPCASPPKGMVAWWPLDENPASSAHDSAASPKADGTTINGPSAAPGQVSGAFSFDGANDYVDIPNRTKLNFGTGDFSIDAWVKTTQTSGVRIIADKRLGSGAFTGYSFFLNNGGILACQIADTATFTNYVDSAATTIADGVWHHVAVTVQRGSATGGKFYVDGANVSTFNPTARGGSLTNTNPLRIGTRAFSVSAVFDGSIDEVELFNRALTFAELSGLYSAGTNGKCKERGLLSRYVAFCKNATSSSVRITIYNNTTSAQDYLVTPAGSPSQGVCSANATGLTFIPASQTVLQVAPGTPKSASFVVDRPPFPSGPCYGRSTATYCMIVTNLSSGAAFACCGTMIDRPDYCWPPITTTNFSFATGLGRPFSGDITNTGESPALLPYRIEAVDSTTGLPSEAIQLNSQAPGVPVDGMLNLPTPGASAPIGVQIYAPAYDRFAYTDLTISTDADGDAQYEPLYSVGLDPREYSRGDMNCDGLRDLLDVPVYVGALLDPNAYQTQYPNCDPYGADFNVDGATDALDTQLFVDALINP